MARIAFSILGAVALLLVGCGKSEKESEKLPELKSRELSKKESKPGKGLAAKAGDTVFVLYRGALTNGKEFDGNMDASGNPDTSKDPFQVVLGSNSVIKGWEQGLLGAQEGSEFKLEIPYQLAYGDEGQSPKIPPRSDLVFEMKVLKVLSESDPEKNTMGIEEVVKGTGKPVIDTSVVNIKYKGSLLNGKVFDDQTAKPITAQLSRIDSSIRAGLEGMKEGGKRKLFVPPGVGNQSGRMPFRQFLTFEVELLKVD